MFPRGGTVVAFCGRILSLGRWNLQMSWCKCPGVPRGQRPGQPPGMAADKCIISSDRSQNGYHLSFRKAHQRACHHLGRKKNGMHRALSLSFLLRIYFLSAKEKIQFFGASRATCQQHFKTSRTGDENVPARILQVPGKIL